MRSSRFSNLPLALLATLAMPLPVQAAAAAPPMREIVVQNDTLGNITVLAPVSEPKLFMFLISGRDGLNAAHRQEAEHFIARGAAVALIDLPNLIKKAAESDDKDCHYTFGDFEDISRVGERDLGMSAWRWPVMMGTGDGGTVAYLTAAQAPDNTAAGAVSLRMSASLASKLPFCGVQATGTADGTFTYSPATSIPGRWTLLAPGEPDESVKAFVTAAPTAKLRLFAQSENALDIALGEVFDIGAPPEEPLAGLPLVELPAKGKVRGVAVFISGDGGWRDIDKQIAEYLSERGVAIVGVDSLRYFWREKQPAQIASDVAKVMSHYSKLWQVRKVSLVGYSLGANVIPFVFNKLDAQTRNAVQSMVLIGLEPTTGFEVTVEGWLGLSSPDEADVRPQLSTLPPSKVMCFYGAAEKQDNETGCTFPELAGAEVIERPGGHHFDGNYVAVAQMILDRLIAKGTG